LPHRINLPSVADGPIGQCVKRALEPLMFGKQRRRTRISFTLEAVPSSLSMAALANLDKCDDVYRICLESVRTYSVPARELVAALMDVNLGGPCNRARTVERYSVRVQIAGDGTFSSVSVSVRSGRKESKACLQNELARARVGPTSNHSRQSASWTVRFDPASQQPYEGLPAHVRLGKIEREGSYSRTRLRKVLRSRLANIRKCYDLALVGDPRSGGESRLSFIVQGSGAISTPQVTGVDASLAACVSKEIGTLTAAKPRHGKAVPVVVPLTFVPARRGTR